ncbi:RluA family pseudouridine synthase [Vallitalea sp.]|jgi:23S rRNA pseudouridine1911/1915/1917 synthase|uniref:RluA family pseudouridine synthase n=1 Tax=Vallitalea sp. TaxID=1882829 RepID=UPI0025E137C5|nr:RluA family pseudouridine synthase [Vallitalea sp.]MCT4688485.1 RluA family pseudouridine synthase [Vallitalea sp.]
MDSYTFLIEAEDAGIRIDKFISDRLPNYSRSFIQKLIKENHLTVNNSAIKSNYKLKVTDEINIVIPEPKELDIVAENIPLDIVYEDKDVILVNKPQGMVVHPAPGHYTGTLVNAIMYHCKDDLSGINGVMRPGIVHRIDKDTSGVLIICKNDKAHESIAKQLKDHTITRKYNAIVYNNIKEDEGVINAPIGRHPVNRKQMAVNPINGKEAITHYEVLERINQYTYVELQLETGRTHQIRVHMTSINNPLLGDPVYGPKSDRFKLKGQALHARVLGFVHPTTNEYMEFEAPLPNYFTGLLKKLRNM